MGAGQPGGGASPLIHSKLKGLVLQRDDAATDSHWDIVVVPESLGEDSATTRVSRPTIAVVKQTIMVMWVQLPPRSQKQYSNPWNHVAVRAKATPEKADP